MSDGTYSRKAFPLGDSYLAAISHGGRCELVITGDQGFVAITDAEAIRSLRDACTHALSIYDEPAAPEAQP